MFGHLYKILWNLRNLVNWLLQYFQIDFRFKRFNPNGQKEIFSKIFSFSTGYEQCFSSINTLILHSFTSSKTFHPKHFIFSQIFSNDSHIFGCMCNSNFCIYVRSFYWRICSWRILLNVGLIFYALLLLVIACIININGSF